MDTKQRCCLTVSLALLVMLHSAAASAQGSVPMRPLGGEAPTTGVRLHAPVVAGDADATAIEVNPGLLGFLPSWSATVHHSQLLDASRIQGSGTALFLAAPLFRGLAIGLGFQWLRPSSAIGYADTFKFSFSAGWALARWFSIGLSYHDLSSGDDPAIDAVDSLDVGLAIRPVEWLGLGLAIRNVTTPSFSGMPLQRVYDAETVIRPLLTNRLEIALGLKAGERRGNLDPYLRLLGEPWRGIRLFSHAELVRRDFYRTEDPATDLRVSLGMAVSWSHLTFAFSTLLGRGMDSGPGPLGEDPATRGVYQGVNFSLAVDGTRRASILASGHAVKLSLSGSLSQRKLVRLFRLFQRVERRPELRGMLIKVDQLRLGWAQAQELRGWIKRLRRTGKRVCVFLRTPDARQYYAMAAADRLVLDPGGGVRLQGLASQQLYFRGLFDKLGIRPEFIRIAEYKTAVEPLTRHRPSNPSKKMMAALVDDLRAQLIADFAADRQKSAEAAATMVEGGPYTPDRAMATGLVDELASAEQIDKLATKRLGAPLVGPGRLAQLPDRWPVGPAVAVIVIDGDIARGKSSMVPLLNRSVVGDDTIAKALASARANPRVKAILLRINSPGGSAVASHRIWRAVRDARQAKPVVVSMGNAAASGGYFAAAGAHRIFAQPASITGSIGIFTGKFDLSSLLAKLGINSHTISRGPRATLDSPFQPYSKEERAFVLARLQYFYRGFLAAVAKGRKLSMDRVHEVARGRVWSGRQASKRGLVDEMGGLAEALADAKRRAGLDVRRPVELMVLPKPPAGLLSQALELMGAKSTAPVTTLPAVLREPLDRIPPTLWVSQAGEPLARLLYYLDY